MAGAALAVVFLAGLTAALIEGPARGWTSPFVLASLVVTVVAGPAFLVLEWREADPMLPLHLFRSRQFSGANAVTFAVYGALGGALFLLPVELQVVEHYTPLDSGLALLPVTLIMLCFSAQSGQLSARIGPRLQMTLGPLLVGAGLALLARATDPGSYWTQVLPGRRRSSAPAWPSPSRPSPPPPWGRHRPSTPASPRRSTTPWPAPPGSSRWRSCRWRPGSRGPRPSARPIWPAASARRCTSPAPCAAGGGLLAALTHQQPGATPGRRGRIGARHACQLHAQRATTPTRPRRPRRPAPPSRDADVRARPRSAKVGPCPAHRRDRPRPRSSPRRPWAR